MCVRVCMCVPVSVCAVYMCVSVCVCMIGSVCACMYNIDDVGRCICVMPKLNANATLSQFA